MNNPAPLTATSSRPQQPWEPYLPPYVTLYFVNYDDDLRHSHELLQECLERNSLYPISEKIDEWWEYPEGYYIDDMKRLMEGDGVEFEDDWVDDIREALWAKDDSDPVKDLLRNTGPVTMYYSLGVDIDGWHEAFLCEPWRGDSEAMAEYKMRRALGVKKGTKAAEQIANIVTNAPYGGEVRVYFAAHISDMLSTEYDGNAADYRTIQFKGEFAVALYNPTQGSGDFEYIELDFKKPFKRDDLAMSDVDRYSLEECFGMCGDWLHKADVPKLSFEGRKPRNAAQPSEAAKRRAREAEYERVFKAGGCTYGDTDFRRHRDTYYLNEVPCGTHCPHCGQFWVD